MLGFNHLGKLGQLGNQMFQFAAIKGISRYIKAPFTIPNHNDVLIDSLGNKLRVELDESFNVSVDKYGFIDTENYILEETFEFDNKFFELDPSQDYSLVGFFQTEKYFKHIEDEIRRDFLFHKEIIEDCNQILSFFETPISLHIRRGDFLINSQNHYNLGLEYYEEALSYFDNNRQVVIFSDDPEWCKEQKIFESDRFLVSDIKSSYHDLYLMTKCNDFIIANSTFSWWGAWLANTGKVISPLKWFGPNNQHKNTADLYCDGWIKI